MEVRGQEEGRSGSIIIPSQVAPGLTTEPYNLSASPPPIGSSVKSVIFSILPFH